MSKFVLVMLFSALVVPAMAADTEKPKAGTAKGAAVGALAGHEVGSGHAVAGAVVGGAVGHHQQKKAEEKQTK